MIEIQGGFSGFSVIDMEVSRKFYRDVLGLTVSGEGYASFIELPGSTRVFFYPKGNDHAPAMFTILNLRVTDIDEAVDNLSQKGVIFEQYEYTDEKGIQRGIAKGLGPDQAWFKDPSGNIMSILVENNQVV